MRCLLCILLGMVTTIAVAWGCAWMAYRAQVNGTLTLRGQDFAFLTVLDSGDFWQGAGSTAFGYAWVSTRVMGHEAHTHRMAVIDDAIEHARAAGATDNHRNPFYDRSPQAASWIKSPRGMFPPQRQVGVGWPAICLRGTMIGIAERPGIIESRHPPTDGLILPWHPVPAGLLVNTAIYGGAWSVLLFFGPGFIIRSRRRRLGQCVHCGYDQRGLSPGRACPECGKSIHVEKSNNAAPASKDASSRQST